MFSTAHTAAQTKLKSHKYDESDLSTLPSSNLPERYTLRDIHQHLIPNEDDDDGAVVSKDAILKNVFIIASCLNHPSASESLVREDGDSVFVEKISLWIAKVILPDGSVIAENYESEDDEAYTTALHQTRYLGIQGVSALSSFSILDPSPSSPHQDNILLALLIFSLPSPWTTPQSNTISLNLLSRHTTYLHNPEFIHHFLLTRILRPFFSASRPSTITSSGRKAMSSSAPPRHFETLSEEKARMPWRYEAPYAVPVLSWVIENIPEELLRTTSFPNLTPPLLTLLDSLSFSSSIHTPSYRLLALTLLPTFLNKLTPKILHETGLGSVFEDAISPTLHFLPSITPLAESLELLEAAYKALFVLLDVRFPQVSSVSVPSSMEKPGKSASKEREKQEENKKERRKFLDRIFRNGIMVGLQHCQEIPSMMELLLRQTEILVGKMGIWAVRQLKNLLPILSTILTNPFITSTPQLLLTSVLTLQTLLVNTWPRIGVLPHRLILLQTLSLSYGILFPPGSSALEEGVVDEIDKDKEEREGERVEEREGEGEGEKGKEKLIQKARQELLKTGKIFVAAVEAGEEEGKEGGIWDEINAVVGENPGLRELFGSPGGDGDGSGVKE